MRAIEAFAMMAVVEMAIAVIVMVLENLIVVLMVIMVFNSKVTNLAMA